MPLLTWGEASPPAPDSEITGDKDSGAHSDTPPRNEPESILNSPLASIWEIEGDFVGHCQGRRRIPCRRQVDQPEDGALQRRPRHPCLERPRQLHSPGCRSRSHAGPCTPRTSTSNTLKVEPPLRPHNEKMQGGDCWVRMERKGSQIRGSISFDGKTWKELKPIQTVWPAKLKVGVSATSSSNQPFSVIFEELEIKGKEKKGSRKPSRGELSCFRRLAHGAFRRKRFLLVASLDKIAQTSQGLSQQRTSFFRR